MKASIFSALLLISAAGTVRAEPLPGAETKAVAPAEVFKTATGLYWYDGTAKRSLQMEPDSAIQFGAAAADEEALAAAGFGASKPQGKARLWKRPRTFAAGKTVPETAGIPANAGKTSPAFRGEDGALRALPGGIVVKFRNHWTDKDARTWAARNGVTLLRKLPLRGVWMVEAAPGLPSLELANRLHEAGEVEWASPDWWREIAKK